MRCWQTGWATDAGPLVRLAMAAKWRTVASLQVRPETDRVILNYQHGAVHLERFARLIPLPDERIQASGGDPLRRCDFHRPALLSAWPIPARGKHPMIERQATGYNPDTAGLRAGHPERPWLAQAQGDAPAHLRAAFRRSRGMDGAIGGRDDPAVWCRARRVVNPFRKIGDSWHHSEGQARNLFPDLFP